MAYRRFRVKFAQIRGTGGQTVAYYDQRGAGTSDSGKGNFRFFSQVCSGIEGLRAILVEAKDQGPENVDLMLAKSSSFVNLAAVVSAAGKEATIRVLAPQELSGEGCLVSHTARLDLGLTQKEAAREIEGRDVPLRHGENHQTSTQTYLVPCVITFLG